MSGKRKSADIDEVMYSCGLEVIHPGGLEKSVEMAAACGITEGMRILDIGSGKGATACFLSEHVNCAVTGIDQSKAMIESARKRAVVNGSASFIRADAAALPFDDESFDIVLIECVTTLIDKKAAFTEILRVLKPGSCIGDLEMTWRGTPPDELITLAAQQWDGFQTMTEDGWTGFFRTLGLEDVTAVDFSDLIPDMGKTIARKLGPAGILRLTGKLLFRPPLLRAMIKYNKIFSTYADNIGYAYFTGRKPACETF